MCQKDMIHRQEVSGQLMRKNMMQSYEQPVTYWMPFNGNVGIHDADTWRSEYGGEIYKTSGSHGCVNTPTANAEKIFNTVEIGTPVIVY